MKIEIERKFLLASDAWTSSVQRSEDIRDGLLFADDGRKLRVRIIGERATLTVKTRRVEGASEEFEYAIPRQDGERLITHCGADMLEKRRHYVAHGESIWEVDVYSGLLEGVMLAEIELQSLDQDIDLPHWVGREVTGEPQYRKANMLRAMKADPR